MTDSNTEIWPEEKREDVDLGFSMKIDGHQPDAEMPTDLFAVRPDTRGPKTIGVLLILGALVLLGQAYGDIGLHSADDLSSEEVDLILDVPNSQGDGTNDVSSEQYQTFHDAARDSGGYAVRGYGLALASLLLIIGGVMLMFLNGTGAKLSVAGAGIGLVSGTAGSLMIKGAADEHLQGVLLLTYEITTYFCGVCMVMCLGLAALPLINARARMALYPQPKVKLSQYGEE